MLDLDKWRELWQTIRRHKLRTALTCFGVFWGIFMLVILLGAGQGLHRGTLQNFDVVRNAAFVWTRETAVAFAGFKAGRKIELNNADMRALENLPAVGLVAARLQVTSALAATAITIERGDNAVAFNIMGDQASFIDVKPYRLEQGRFLNRFDIERSRKVVAIGRRVRDELFSAGENVIGEYIRIGAVPFQVIGVFNSRASGDNALQDLQTVHIPLTSAQQTFNRPNRVSWFALLPAAGYRAEEALAASQQLLSARHKIAPNDRQALASFNVETEYNNLQGMFQSISAFSWLVAIGTIFAGMVGVANIMLISVRERTREIGIRKSLGATPASIVTMILLEALVISGFAGYLGLVAGVGLVEGVGLLMQKLELHSDFFAAPQIDLGIALAALTVLFLAGLLAGLVPGLKAARVNPITALRDE